MPSIFEIFGHRLDDNSPEAQHDRGNAWCPFMNQPCDGGGNRYLSEISLTTAIHQELQRLYPDRDKIHAGVCSIQPKDGVAPWIVCPRRLLVLGREAFGTRARQQDLETKTLQLLNYPPGTRLGIWPEVKVQYSGTKGSVSKNFDYTFDYVVMPVMRTKFDDIAALLLERNTSQNQNALRRSLARAGYLASSDDFIDDFPVGRPSIVEIMTSSTSGGNKNRRSTIPQSFEDALLRKPHNAPGINYRQVWARMVSQLLVKSEVALGWGGVAVWVVQDVLIEYISSTTGINIRDFLNSEVGQVNMLSFSYGSAFNTMPTGVLELPDVELFSGPIAPLIEGASQSTFLDIVRAPIQPPLSRLIGVLIGKGPSHTHAMTPEV